MSTLTMKNLQKKYPNGYNAVPGLDLHIEDGEFLVLVGPSGCGKSTVLRMVAGLEDITGGDLMIDDTRVNDKGPQERDIAMVFQSYALYPNMTVEGNIAFAMKLRKTDKEQIKRKVAEVAELPSSRRCSTASPASCRVVSVNAWRWAVRSCVSPSCS